MLTTPTPLICEIFCAIRVSTRSSTSVSAMVFDVMPRIRTGASAGLTLAEVGGAGRSRGEGLCPALAAGWADLWAPAMARAGEDFTLRAPGSPVRGGGLW